MKISTIKSNKQEISILIIVDDKNEKENNFLIGNKYRIHIIHFDTILNEKITVYFGKDIKRRNPFEVFDYIHFDLEHNFGDLLKSEAMASLYSLGFMEKNV